MKERPSCAESRDGTPQSRLGSLAVTTVPTNQRLSARSPTCRSASARGSRGRLVVVPTTSEMGGA
jgi:hypothetical protein